MFHKYMTHRGGFKVPFLWWCTFYKLTSRTKKGYEDDYLNSSAKWIWPVGKLLLPIKFSLTTWTRIYPGCRAQILSRKSWAGGIEPCLKISKWNRPNRENSSSWPLLSELNQDMGWQKDKKNYRCKQKWQWAWWECELWAERRRHFSPSVVQNLT